MSERAKKELIREIESKINELECIKIGITESIIKKGFITVQLELDLETIQLAEANINPLKKDLKDNIRVDKTEVEELQDEVNHVTPEFRSRLKRAK